LEKPKSGAIYHDLRQLRGFEATALILSGRIEQVANDPIVVKKL
jgi:hypothetical protein